LRENAYLIRIFQSLNQVVLWDKIIRRGENARLTLRDIATKYYFWDDGENLRLHLTLFFVLQFDFFVFIDRIMLHYD